MLDNETKRRIDNARDILVGKVPDPKSQVEQITIALIYKFMDDMDAEAEELGGDASFFSGEYDKYGWRKIFNPGMGGFEMLSLYSEAILKMAQNPNLPQLFRDIFKNAYLPYRDPETLKSFLKIIDDFSYDQSEKLGDAFEYLLSILGSQGDAGQFRTPRHIIDFMTALISPKKNETILDPACGTAGFLISAYKQIIKYNSSNYDAVKDRHAFEMHNVKLEELVINGKQYKGDQICPDERTRLINGIRGYDISPDMVRLSLVNLYLHGFTDPHIYEYDTLTSEDRWNEYFDVILANPPFMSPKGGIRPHKRFSIQSNRSEVLFVDYMVEHLTPTGRAAIIVPEGIIFQSGTAYKSLRKMLVEENYLVGIISLPAGVFNPYSGVKTSILWIDKSLARKTDKIIFAKITADGFDLGAQRRSIKQNDMPGLFKKLTNYRNALLNGEEIDFEGEELISLVVKSEIAEKGEYNLSGEIYKISHLISTNYEIVSLGDLEKENKLFFLRGSGISKKDICDNGKYKCIHYGDLYTKFNEIIKDVIATTNYEGSTLSIAGDVLVPSTTTADALGISIARALNQNNVILGGDINIIRTKNEFINSIYLAYLISNPPLKIILSKYAKGTNILHLSNNDLKKLQIPLPPLSIQEEIVAEIESYQKIIDGARQIVENYKPKIDINPEWEMVELGDVCEINPKKTEISAFPEELDVSFVPMADLNANEISFLPKQIKPLREVIKGYTYFKEDDVLLAKVTPCFENGKAGIAKGLVNKIGFGSSEYYVFRPNEKILSTWIYLNIIPESFRELGKLKMTGTGGLQRVPKEYVASLLIPFPSIDIQQQIVSRIEKEQELVNSSKQLIEIFEQKIKVRIAKVWGE